MVTTKIIQKKSGQYRVTVPKGVAEAMDLDGAEVEWITKSRNRIELQVTERNSGDSEGGENE